MYTSILFPGGFSYSTLSSHFLDSCLLSIRIMGENSPYFIYLVSFPRRDIPEGGGVGVRWMSFCNAVPFLKVWHEVVLNFFLRSLLYFPLVFTFLVIALFTVGEGLCHPDSVISTWIFSPRSFGCMSSECIPLRNAECKICK